jgi:hypothetical protein
MINTDQTKLLSNFWKSNNDRIVLWSLLLVFLAYSLFIALNLQEGVLPDEPPHFIFSKHFSTTLGIPSDVYETYSWGWYIQQSPFLYYWVMARVINLISFVSPSTTDWQLLVILRVVNILFALGTIIFCFLLSKEVIKHKWWQLFPVFILTNLLMFVFLAAGVNYDNLANLFSMMALFFLVRVLLQKNFIINSLLWMIFISLGTLVKYPIVPLALSMAIVWIVYIILSRKELPNIRFDFPKILLSSILGIFLVVNFLIYGVNLIRYQALTPPCREILTDAQCDISPWVIRFQETAVIPKLTVSQAIEQGYPTPIGYALVDWVWYMLFRSVGVAGHESYLPFQVILYYQLLFYWIILMALINFIYHRQIDGTKAGLLFISGFYALVLIFMNYNSELTYGFQQISLQGRYIFPVLGALLVLFALVVKNIPLKILRWGTLLYIFVLFIYGGPLIILYGYNTYFSGWFH